MTFRNTKRVAKYAGNACLFLLPFVITVRATNLPLGNVQPEAVMMTLPFTLGVTGAVIGGAAARDYFSGRSRSRANTAA